MVGKQQKNIRVAVVCGGGSPEAEVSRRSGEAVAAALSASYDSVNLVELDVDLAKKLRAGSYDVVFPALHGPPGEDGTVQGLFEILAIPYVGSGVRASALAMDKHVAKRLFSERGLPVANDILLDSAIGIEMAVKQTRQALGDHVVCKPLCAGSALGVRFAHSEPELRAALEAGFSEHDRLLAEQFVEGREITVGVLELDDAAALPVCEITTPQGFWYDYHHRYTVGKSEHLIPAPLSEQLTTRLQGMAVAAHLALGCRDLSRADFVLPDKGEPILLEINTMPGMTETSLYPDEARAAGIDFSELVCKLVEQARLRAR